MSEHLKRAEELRAITERHYNCAQSVFITFSEQFGIEKDTALKLSSSFGGGACFITSL